MNGMMGNIASQIGQQQGMQRNNLAGAMAQQPQMMAQRPMPMQRRPQQQQQGGGLGGGIANGMQQAQMMNRMRGRKQPQQGAAQVNPMAQVSAPTNADIGFNQSQADAYRNQLASMLGAGI